MSEWRDDKELMIEKEVLDQIPSGVGIFDLTDRHVEMRYLNAGYYQMLGLTGEDREKYLGEEVIKAIHPEDRKKVLEEAGNAILENRLFEMRFRVLGGTGVYLWIGIRANHHPMNENTERFYASCYNVNTYMDRQTRLEEKSNDLSTILGHVPGGVAIFSARGREIHLEYANTGFYEIHYGSREYWTGMSDNPVEWLLEEDKEVFFKELEKVTTGIQKNGNVAYRITGEDRKSHWVNNQFRLAYVKGDVTYYYASFTGLDELKQAEHRGLEIRKMYEMAVEDSNLVVWEYDLIRHTITMAENEFTQYDYRKFGLPKVTENAPEALVPYIDDASVPTFLDLYSRVEQGEAHASCEVWYKIKPGSEPRCEKISYTTIFDQDGQPIKAYGTGQNITRQKLDQAEYDRLKAQLIGNMRNVISSTQLNLTKNLFLDGYSPYPSVEERLNKETADEHFKEAAAPVINDKIKQEIIEEFNCSALLLLFQNGIKQKEKVYPIKSMMGGVMWIETTLYMMQNPSNGDVEAITYSRNITRQKRNNEIISRLSSSSCDYIGVLDPLERSFEMHTSNWECDKFTAGQKIDYDQARGIVIEEFLKQEYREDFDKATSIGAIQKALRNKPQYVVAYDYAEEDSNKNLKKQIVFSKLNGENREILCVQQDITEAYQLEQKQIQALREAKMQADMANEAKSMFLSGMSHDLRTPLNGVLGFTALALKETDEEKKQGYLQKIDTSGQLLRDLINDTLELSRIESGKTKLEEEAVLQRDLIPAVITALRPTAELKRMQYKVNMKIEEEVPVWCDKLKVQKIALNLISNAIKYTLDEGVVTIDLSLTKNRSRGIYHFSVEDNGIGMSREFVTRMFEPFAQEKRSEYIREPGTGLGLSIVKRYLDLMGGTIKVTSKIHEGTKIEVDFPVKISQASGRPKENEKAELKTLEGKHILLCEDNYMNTEIAVMLLRDRGLLVDTAEHGKMGLEKFELSAPGEYDGILMDIRMPIMDGYEATRRIRKLDRPDAQKIPIIAMTADAFEESTKEALAAGMNGYVTKPVDPQALFAILREKLI